VGCKPRGPINSIRFEGTHVMSRLSYKPLLVLIVALVAALSVIGASALQDGTPEGDVAGTPMASPSASPVATPGM
jgi:hypothetical protein